MTLCPYCLQQNPSPDHMQAHSVQRTPLDYENYRMIAARRGTEA